MDRKTLEAKMIEAKLRVPKNIYVDLILIKDFFLGTILDMISKADDAQESYLYIMKNLSTYCLRVLDDISLIFPELNITQDQVEDYQKTTSHAQLFQVSPVTEFFNFFNQHIATINNHAAVLKDTNICTITMSTYPLVLPAAIKLAIKTEFEAIYAMDINIVDNPIHELPEEKVYSFDDIFIYDFKSLIENPIYAKGFQDAKFFNTFIWAKRQIEGKNILESHKTLQEIEEGFALTAAYLELACRFKYLPPLAIKIATKEKSNGEETTR